MILPTLHLNGTSSESLADGYAEAMKHLRAAMRALDACSPNARDYYPQGPAAYGQAAREHEARAKSVRAVATELQALLEHCNP